MEILLEHKIEEIIRNLSFRLKKMTILDVVWYSFDTFVKSSPTCLDCWKFYFAMVGQGADLVDSNMQRQRRTGALKEGYVENQLFVEYIYIGACL